MENIKTVLNEIDRDDDPVNLMRLAYQEKMYRLELRKFYRSVARLVFLYILVYGIFAYLEYSRTGAISAIMIIVMIATAVVQLLVVGFFIKPRRPTLEDAKLDRVLNLIGQHLKDNKIGQ